MDWIEAINGPGGAIVLLLVIIATGAKGIWIFGRELASVTQRYEAALLDVRAERDEWKRVAFGGTRLAEKAVGVAEQTGTEP